MTPTGVTGSVESLRLHVPEEPAAHKARWLAAVLDGADLAEVLAGADGVVAWLWSRWRVLERVGVHQQDLGQAVTSYRREIWLWLAGERTWSQCCEGLIGRVGRRGSSSPASPAPVAAVATGQRPARRSARSRPRG
ncbi:MAG TPA: hypothetical protein VGL60_05550 [Acidimicrobiales bacterium]